MKALTEYERYEGTEAWFLLDACDDLTEKESFQIQDDLHKYKEEKKDLE